jgi:4-carboxymuconolactone decarboxylase
MIELEEKMARLTAPAPDRMNPAQRRIYDEIMAGPRGTVPAPLTIWLHRPELADRAQRLGQYCRYETCLGPRLSELAIMITAAVWRSAFEWHAHEPHAREAGVAPEILEAIRTGREPAFAEEDEAALYAFVRSVHINRGVSDEVFARVKAALGDEGVVDLTGLLGYYTLISMTLNTFEIGAPDGSDPFA